MAPLTALILALAFPASAQMRAEKPCTDKENAAVAAALPEAKKRVAAARKTVAGGDGKTAAAGRMLFASGYDAGEVGVILEGMGAQLDGFAVRCATDDDANCGGRGGYVRSDEKGIVHLCPKFFNEVPLADSASPAEQRVRTLVHESAHLAHPNISEPKGESYCVIFTCEDSCGDGPRDETTGKSVPARVADNWSQFVHCASGQTPDETETITASPRKKR